MNALEAATYKQPGPQHGPDSQPIMPSLAHFLSYISMAHLLPSLEARHQEGMATYGVPLSTHNGRENLPEIYQEALDGVNYAFKHFLEADTPAALELLFRQVDNADAVYHQIEGGPATSRQACQQPKGGIDGQWPRSDRPDHTGYANAGDFAEGAGRKAGPF
jgi:hypothetical protein